MWVCPVCHTENRGGNCCKNCGHDRGDDHGGAGSPRREGSDGRPREDNARDGVKAAGDTISYGTIALKPCGHCGRMIPADSRFCAYCGLAVQTGFAQEPGAATPEGNPSYAGPAPEKEKKRSGENRGRTAGIIIAVVVLIFVVIFFLTDSDDANVGDNVMMPVSKSDASVFGNERYTRDDILTVTFLDTLEDMPEDAWNASVRPTGSVMAWVEPDGVYYDLYIAAEGAVVANQDSSYLFYDYENVESISFNDCFYTGSVTDMSAMFYDCYALQTVDVDGWDTSNVTDMSMMFEWCGILQTVDVSRWDTSNVTDMTRMFCNCWLLQTVDVGAWDTSSVTDMSSMFAHCAALETLDVGGWDTSRVTDMSWMFAYCAALRTVDVSNWDTAHANTAGMFSNTSLE